MQNNALTKAKAKLYAKIMIMQRILIIKTSSLGDIVHNLPVITDIKRHYPNVKIDWLVEEMFTDIPCLHPDVNTVITVAVRRWRKALFSCNTWSEIKLLKQQIQASHYDCVIDTQGLFKSGLLSLLSSGTRHGYDQHSIREPLASCFYHQKHPISKQLHAVTRNRLLVAKSLGYTLEDTPLNYGISAAQTSQLSSPSAFIIGLHATSRDSKLWATEYWVKLAELLDIQGLNLVLPWGNLAEKERAETISIQAKNIIVLPKLSIAELAGVISASQAAVGVDTGLAHLAVALNKPTVAIYVDTNPQLTGLHGNPATTVNLGGDLKSGLVELPTPALVMQTLQNVLAVKNE